MLGRPLGGGADQDAERRVGPPARPGPAAGGAARARTAPRPRSPSASPPATSTPTSTTVVPTSTSRSPSRKRAISASRSTGFSRPWTRPTRSGARTSVRRANSASAAAAHAVSTSSSGQLVVARPAGVPVALALRRLGRPDPRHDDERPVPERRLLADPVPGPLEVVRTADPGPDRRCARWAPRGASRRRGPRTAPGPGCAGSASRSSAGRAARRRGPCPRGPRAAPPRSGAARRRPRGRGRRTRPPPGAARASRRRPAPGPSGSPPGARRRASAGSEPVSRVTPIPRSSSRLATVSRCWRARRSVGASSAAWRPASAAAARAHAATAVLPEPTSPWTRRSIGTGRARSSRISSIDVAWSGVSATSWPSFRPIDASSEARTRRVRGVVDRDRLGVRPAPGAPPPDHPELEREQLVEGEAAERRRRAARRSRG